MFSGAIARMMNSFLSTNKDLDTFWKIVHKKRSLTKKSEESNEANHDINDEDNVSDQFFHNSYNNY